MMVDEQLTTRLDACCSSDEQPENIGGRDGSALRAPHRGSWTGRFREGRLRRALRRLLRSSARASVSAGGCRDGKASAAVWRSRHSRMVILRHRSGNCARCLTRRNPASSRGHGTGRLWDPTTGEPLGAPMKYEGVQDAVFDKVEGGTLSWSQDKIVRP
jgi:hypothetical protein